MSAHRRRRAARVAFSWIGPVALAACAAVAEIEEVRYAPLEGGAAILPDAEPSPAPRDAGADATARDGAATIVGDAAKDAPADADACVRRAPTNTAGLSSCESRVDGKYCGSSSQLNPKTGAYPNAEDLVICAGGRIATTKPCARCIAMTGGRSDECDPCDCLPDGYYCGRDLPEWNVAENGDVQIQCAGGAARLPVKLCATCTSGSQAPCP